ncbi:hypothetical protein ES319_A12G022200v1 [Gossypium barbadense]|uniref:Uncharacterized protein n=2 Tax=Gossypium TaxID=3633 RepID=A0A5J5T593_GOSBA|nr:hypothetical protein ES319_A12G022200v1 [Gossypium barbadense]TYH05388.1 hypothetical protein ES288_A08G079100v1 [Gossypium darwinii]TYH25724.1 hypothetical protein ES288_A03G192100v1 [Gossypium darwinii]
MDSFPRSLNPNKHLREQFVSNLPGSSMLEVAALLNNVAIKVLMPLKLIISVASRITRKFTLLSVNQGILAKARK